MADEGAMNRAMLLPYDGTRPSVAGNVFLAPGAVVIGNVEIAERAGIWFGCVLRGDVNIIKVGAETNIQDGTVVHVTRKTHGTFIGSRVTIGHSALIHGCTLQDDCFIGMRATVMDGCVVESGAMVAAGALVTPGKVVPTGQLWAGSPARHVRDLSDEETAYFADTARHYADLGEKYRGELGL
jgi:carbonic anhydrase/acetyltransferase-like protein (isoleucine patch superfamily)